MKPHRIRLNRQWEMNFFRVNGPKISSVDLPFRLSAEQSTSSITDVILIRRFGKPRMSDPRETIWLRIEGICGTFRVMLNESELSGSSNSFQEWEVTRLLQERNELEVSLLDPQENDGIGGDVYLEIRSEASSE